MLNWNVNSNGPFKLFKIFTFNLQFKILSDSYYKYPLYHKYPFLKNRNVPIISTLQS